MLSDDSYYSDEEEYDELGFESSSSGMFGTGLGGLLYSLWFTLGVTLSSDESCGDDGGSLALPKVNIGEAFTGECTNNANIFSIAQI